MVDESTARSVRSPDEHVEHFEYLACAEDIRLETNSPSLSDLWGTIVDFPDIFDGSSLHFVHVDGRLDADELKLLRSLIDENREGTQSDVDVTLSVEFLESLADLPAETKPYFDRRVLLWRGGLCWATYE